MKIENNNLLIGVSKSIEFYNSCVIAKEGPNMVSKMSLGDLAINYDSILTTRQTLAPETLDMPIMYGFLGTDVTFLMIKPNYGALNPQSCSGATQYLEYYYEDQPLDRRTFTDLLVLTGDANHRIPQIYLFNPNSGIVTLDIMIANMDENIISSTLVPTYSEIQGLSFSNIQTDQIFGVNVTGSTQFEIYDIENNIQMVIPYNKIEIITIDSGIMTISTKYDDNIKLSFLSDFNALQALSRMNYVMSSSINRYATAISPGIDMTSPIINFNSIQSPQPMSYVGGVISQSDIRTRFINTVVDYDNAGIERDGVIDTNNVSLVLINTSSAEQVTGITTDGNYTVTFMVSDTSGNETSSTKSIIVDELPPVITYNSIVSTVAPYVVLSANTYMSLSADTSTPGTISGDDLEVFYMNYIWDDVDGDIALSATTITIMSGSTIQSDITTIGDYNVTFSISDYSSNETSATTILTVSI